MLDIYIGNLPDRARIDELRELLDEVVGPQPTGSIFGGILPRVGKKRPSDFVRFTLVADAPAGQGRYCRVSGQSRVIAKRMIAQLSGVGLHGQVLEVRPFYPRDISNDRRRAGWHFRLWLGVERRIGERRAEP
ncbi:MAG TPA: RNA-binding protein [Gammaproteobacteria bacterium]|nr:RNA-binding protein [Gammaproteobacteria bacterium]